MKAVMDMGEVLHNQAGEHHADIEEDSLHGVVAQEVVELRVAHHGEEAEEGDEGDRVAVEDLQQGEMAAANLPAWWNRHERLVRERDGAHAGNQVRQQREEAELKRGIILWVGDAEERRVSRKPSKGRRVGRRCAGTSRRQSPAPSIFPLTHLALVRVRTKNASMGSVRHFLDSSRETGEELAPPRRSPAERRERRVRDERTTDF